MATRRPSTRLQAKDLDGPATNGTTKSRTAAAKKSKADWEEDNDGFQFTRGKTKRPRAAAQAVESVGEQAEESQQKKRRKSERLVASSKEATSNGIEGEDRIGRRRRDNTEERIPAETATSKISRSKALESVERNGAQVGSAEERRSRPAKSIVQDPPNLTRDEIEREQQSTQDEAKKIALPFADTPVIRRNKEMRKEKSGKSSSRRSSVGMRGRRASSLIESGESIALPHNAVSMDDFYKHIEGQIPEPRRMKQLLTWCATRVMGEKPMNFGSEDERSARLAARVIQGEILEEIGNRSELSDWFSREDTVPAAVVVKKPNPRNEQNAAKVEELEQQIKRLQAEKDSLKALLKQPPIPSLRSPPKTDLSAQRYPKSQQPPPPVARDIDPNLLDEPQQDLLSSLTDPATSTTSTVNSVSTRVNTITSTLPETLDAFADGLHRIEQFRDVADRIAGKVLKVCADRLEEREKIASTVGAGDADSESQEAAQRPKINLNKVLHSLSKVERQY